MTGSAPQQQVVKKGFGLKAEVAPLIRSDFWHPLVQWMRMHGNRVTSGRVTFHLAKEFGFCYGVDFAIDYAYETRQKFPDRTIYITGEIIHNPMVNARLRAMGVEVLPVGDDMEADLKQVRAEDVVLIPAFGVSFPVLEALKAKGCVLVDTTCASVVNVWRNVERYAKHGMTAVIHGKYQHEETIATASYALRFGGHYVVVRDLDEADLLCAFIRGIRPLSEFGAAFEGKCSPGFDPARHLSHLGLANQTTMLSSESLEVQQRVAAALREVRGEAELPAETFRAFDTICSATQDRQDAVQELIAAQPDLMIVIGGYNSSNTTHLAALGRAHGIATYHVSSATDIRSAEELQHKPGVKSNPVPAHRWLPDGPVVIGITAGASTPNQQIGEAIERIARFAGTPLDPAQFSAEEAG